MEIELFSFEQWYVFLVILARMAAMVGSLPVFSSSHASIRLRLGLAVGISVLIFPAVNLLPSDHYMTSLGFGLIIIQEALLGMLMGFVVQLIFFAVQFGTTIVGYQMGFSAAEILDPQHHQQVPLLSQFQNIIALLFFLTLDIHHMLLRVIVHSYKVLPPGELDFSGNAIPFILEMTGNMFGLGLRLVTPVMVVLMLSNFILGIMSRVFSQLQVFMFSFPINISLALIVISLSMGIMLSFLEREFYRLQGYLLHILDLL